MGVTSGRAGARCGQRGHTDSGGRPAPRQLPGSLMANPHPPGGLFDDAIPCASKSNAPRRAPPRSIERRHRFAKRRFELHSTCFNYRFMHIYAHIGGQERGARRLRTTKAPGAARRGRQVHMTPPSEGAIVCQFKGRCRLPASAWGTRGGDGRRNVCAERRSKAGARTRQRACRAPGSAPSPAAADGAKRPAMSCPATPHAGQHRQPNPKLAQAKHAPRAPLRPARTRLPGALYAGGGAALAAMHPARTCA